MFLVSIKPAALLAINKSNRSSNAFRSLDTMTAVTPLPVNIVFLP